MKSRKEEEASQLFRVRGDGRKVTYHQKLEAIPSHLQTRSIDLLQVDLIPFYRRAEYENGM